MGRYASTAIADLQSTPQAFSGLVITSIPALPKRLSCCDPRVCIMSGGEPPDMVGTSRLTTLTVTHNQVKEPSL